jgi:hypothetical protein
MGNLKNKRKYAPNCQLLVMPIEGLGLLRGEGASPKVDGSKVEDDENGKLTHKK